MADYANMDALYNQYGKGVSWENGLQQYYSSSDYNTLIQSGTSGFYDSNSSQFGMEKLVGEHPGLGTMTDADKKNPITFDPTVGTWVGGDGKPVSTQQFTQYAQVAQQNQADNAKMGWMDWLPLIVIGAMTGGAALGALPAAGAAGAVGVSGAVEGVAGAGVAGGLGATAGTAGAGAGGLGGAPGFSGLGTVGADATGNLSALSAGTAGAGGLGGAPGISGLAGTEVAGVGATGTAAASVGGLGGGAAEGVGAAGTIGASSELGSLLGPALQGLTGLAGLAQANKLNASATAAANSADPFASQRAQYGTMLQQLMTNPNATLPNIPGYQAGLEAVQRAGNAQGFQGSGNMAANLLQYGGNMFQQQEQNLAQLAGANFNNAPAAAQIQQQGATNAVQLQGNALNTLSNAVMTGVQSFNGTNTGAGSYG